MAAIYKSHPIFREAGFEFWWGDDLDYASARLSMFGPNQLESTPPVSTVRLLLGEFRSPIVIVLIAAAVVLVGVSQITDNSDQLIDASLIRLIVVLNASLGFTQNYRANRGIESLERLSAPSLRARTVSASSSLAVRQITGTPESSRMRAAQYGGGCALDGRERRPQFVADDP